MKQVVAVRKWAQSRAIAIPRVLCDQLKWRVGDIVHLEVQGDALIVKPVDLPKSRRLEPSIDAMDAAADVSSEGG